MNSRAWLAGSGLSERDIRQERYRHAHALLVGRDGIALERFLSKPVTHWMAT